METIYKKVSEEFNIPVKEIKNLHKHYWTHIRNKIKSLELKEDITEEEFNKLKNDRIDFSITGMGILRITYGRLKGIFKINRERKLKREGLKNEKDFSKEGEANV